jgi:hypothetical protein
MKTSEFEGFRNYVELLCSAAGDAGREQEAAQHKGSNLKFFAVRVPRLRQMIELEFRFDKYSPIEWIERWDRVFHHSLYYEPISLGLLFYQVPDRTRVCGFIDSSTTWASKIENWGHCDLLGSAMSAYGTHSWANLETYMMEWSRSESIWLRRLSLVSLVRYVGKSSTYLPFSTVASFIEPHLDTRDKYISRPVGWVLREHLRADPNGEPREYLKRHWSRLPYPAKAKLQLFTKLEAAE